MKGFKSLKTTPHSVMDYSHKAYNHKSSSRYSVMLLIALCAAPLALTGCEPPPPQNPMLQTIPTDAEKWQDELGDTLDRLSEEDRQLLSRYMIRMRLSEAYEKGAMPRISIGKALEQQRQYEMLHPNNPTGRKSPVTQDTQQNEFTITLLPARTSTTDSLNNVELSFVLANRGSVAVSSFKGTLLLRYPAFKKPKPVVIPLTKFEPPIAPNNANKIIADVSITDTNVMKAIQNPQNIEIVITNGEMVLSDGRVIEFE